MFTRVTLQGSLVALQQHIRSKAPVANGTRERSHSLDDTTLPEQHRSGARGVNDNSTTAHAFAHSFVAQPAPVAVDYLAGWGNAATVVSTTTPTKVPNPQTTTAAAPTSTSQGVQAASTAKPLKCSTSIAASTVTQQSAAPPALAVAPATVAEEEAEVILSYDEVDPTPTATYHYGAREVVVHNICAFLETWLTSFKHSNMTNPHGWDCLRKRKQQALQQCPAASSCNSHNTAHASCGDALHYLYGTTIPTIGMKDYLLRLTEYFRTTDAVFIVATHYFSRVVEAYQEQQQQNLRSVDGTSLPIITPWSLHRIYFACCVLAAKWLEDVPFDNHYYASVGGISTFELSHVETALLGLLDYNVFVAKETVDEAWEALQQLGSGYQQCGWADPSSGANASGGLSVPPQSAYHPHQHPQYTNGVSSASSNDTPFSSSNSSNGSYHIDPSAQYAHHQHATHYRAQQQTGGWFRPTYAAHGSAANPGGMFAGYQQGNGGYYGQYMTTMGGGYAVGGY